jgi:hypothetical protein
VCDAVILVLRTSYGSVSPLSGSVGKGEMGQFEQRDSDEDDVAIGPRGQKRQSQVLASDDDADS